jgi:hypothetical protein
MPSLSSFLSRTCRSLSGHLGRLGRSFDSLAVQVREAIARSVGRTVAEAVTEAVQAALAASPADAALPPAPAAYPGRPPPLWDEADGPAWRDAAHYPSDPDRPRDPYDLLVGLGDLHPLTDLEQVRDRLHRRDRAKLTVFD